MRHPLQVSFLCLSAATAGMAARRGEVDKDGRHEAAVQAAGGIFIPLVVDTLGLWSPNSLIVLKNVALCTISKSSTSSALAFCHFLEQLSMCLWKYNSQMLLHHLNLLPGDPLWELGGWSLSSLYLVVFATLSHLYHIETPGVLPLLAPGCSILVIYLPVLNNLGFGPRLFCFYHLLNLLNL